MKKPRETHFSRSDLCGLTLVQSCAGGSDVGVGHDKDLSRATTAASSPCELFFWNQVHSKIRSSIPSARRASRRKKKFTAKDQPRGRRSSSHERPLMDVANSRKRAFAQKPGDSETQ